MRKKDTSEAAPAPDGAELLHRARPLLFLLRDNPALLKARPPSSRGLHGLSPAAWKDSKGRPTHAPDQARVRQAALNYVVSWWGEDLFTAVACLWARNLFAVLALKHSDLLERYEAETFPDVKPELRDIQSHLDRLASRFPDDDTHRPLVTRLRTARAALAFTEQLADELPRPLPLASAIEWTEATRLATRTGFLRRVHRKLPQLPNSKSATTWAYFAIATGADPVPADAGELQTVSRPRWAQALARSKP